VIIKKGKTNRGFILITAMLAASVGGFLLPLQMSLLDKDLSAEISAILKGFVPMPTAIDSNFLNQVNECFIPTAAVYGYTLRITSGFRSIAEQDQLFEQGRTIDGHIVSWALARKSLHNYGFAVDVVDRWRGYDIDWKKLGKIGAFCGLEQVDDSHFEHRSGLTTAQFEAGIRPSLLTLPCALMDERAKANQPLTLKDLKDCGAPKF
jgi:hypothetical protein